MVTRTVISKAKKQRKETDGNKLILTEMVVYRRKLPNGKYTSVTIHELQN